MNGKLTFLPSLILVLEVSSVFWWFCNKTLNSL